MPAVRRRTRAAPGAEAKAISDPEAKLAALVEELELEGAPHPVRSAACVEGPCERAAVQWVGPPRGASRRVCACTDAGLSAVESKCTSLQSEAERMATTVRYARRRSPRAIAPRSSQLPERTRQSYHEAARKLTCSSGNRSQFKVQLSKLPQKVRNMTVAEFFAQVVARRWREGEREGEGDRGHLSLSASPPRFATFLSSSSRDGSFASCMWVLLVDALHSAFLVFSLALPMPPHCHLTAHTWHLLSRSLARARALSLAAMLSAPAAEQTGAAADEMEVPELRELATKYHSAGGDTEMSEAAASAGAASGQSRAPLMVVNNDNGTKTVLRSTRKAAMPSSIMPPTEDAAPRTTRRTTRTQSITAATPAANKTGHGFVAQTPKFNPDLPYTPAVGHHASVMGGGPAAGAGLSTCLRLPRRGESILSSRGSPIMDMKSDATAQMIMDGDSKIAALAICSKQGGESFNIADPSVCTYCVCVFILLCIYTSICCELFNIANPSECVRVYIIYIYISIDLSTYLCIYMCVCVSVYLHVCTL